MGEINSFWYNSEVKNGNYYVRTKPDRYIYRVFTQIMKKKISWEFPDFPEVVLLKILGEIIF